MSSWQDKVVLLPPNRVARSYQGGRWLDKIAGVPSPADGPTPEDWIGSVTEARHGAPRAGISSAVIAGRSQPLDAWFARDPHYFLGAQHAAEFGTHPAILVKLIDSAIRLHFQFHPDTASARRLGLGAFGKTEAYHVLDIREDQPSPYVYLGFNQPLSRAEVRALIEHQDMHGLASVLNRVPLRRGDTFIVPAGVPHALGEGVLLLELQEPSDLVVRMEFERGCLVIPESQRFMGRTLEFCLELLDLTARDERATLAAFRCAETPIADSPDHVRLIGPEVTRSFSMERFRAKSPVMLKNDGLAIGLVASGGGTVFAGGEPHQLKRFDKILLPAGLGQIELHPNPALELILCRPPR